MTVAERLFAEGFSFEFFQAVRLLTRVRPDRKPVGAAVPPREEIVRFHAHAHSLDFPPSPIYEIRQAADALEAPSMTVAFMGLTGPNGILPRHYTEKVLRLALDSETRNKPERTALRDWLDLFNHRLISLFYRAWEKYRFHLAYERGAPEGPEPDPFTRCLFSLIGLGLPALRDRVRVSSRVVVEGVPSERVLGRIDDLALLYYGGLLAQRPRNAVALEAILADYFGLPVRVLQFQGQWLRLDEANQSQLGAGNNQLGANLVAGQRVWDVQSKVRLRLGPLRREQFDDLLPDRSPVPRRKTFFVLSHLARLYLGPDFDFDVQLVLRAADVPGSRLGEARLGWNTWVRTGPAPRDAEDPVFAGDDARWVN
jgi:type VI secretion system protein ImpH